MHATDETVYAEPPSAVRAFLAGGWRARPGLPDGAPLPDLRARLTARPIEEAHVARYREVASLTAEVPLPYPQLLATPVHVAMLTAPSFPFKALGLVHPRFRVVQRRALAVGEVLEVRCGVSGRRDLPNGVEFDLTATGTVGGEEVWESAAATFYRTKKSEGGGGEPDPGGWTTEVPLVLPADAGRRYAGVSGDANPVHLHPLTARLFGFPKPIAHGWYLLARCLGGLGRDGATEPTVVDIAFHRPVWLPGTYRLVSRPDGSGVAFGLLDSDGKLRLSGRVGPA